MPRILVIQCHNKDTAGEGWLARCLASVRDWTDAQGFDYAFHGDEALAKTPTWYRKKAGAKTPVVTDHTRLVLLQEALEAGYDRAAWLDADTLVFAPERFRPDETAGHQFGVETWVEPDPKTGRLRARRNVHNAALAFAAGDPVLPFLRHVTESVIRRADPAKIAPQMVGPKLAGALHSIADFTLWPEAGAFSPAVLQDIAAGGGPALDLLRTADGPDPAAANLCLSLRAETRDVLDAACERLLQTGGLP